METVVEFKDQSCWITQSFQYLPNSYDHGLHFLIIC